MLPDGIVRTPMGAYVLRDDVLLSRIVERENRLDTRDNIIEIASFAYLIPEGGVVVDAGAFIGDHTVSYSQIVGVNGVVHAFEPHPVTYEALALNAARLRNVLTYPLGLSDAPGYRPFTLDGDANFGAAHVTGTGELLIEVVTLDEFLLPKSMTSATYAHPTMPLGRCDFIHLDAEGEEPYILQGARELIEKFHPLMLIEVCDKHLRRAGSSEDELLGMLRGLGYTMKTIPSHLEPELRDDLCTWGQA